MIYGKYTAYARQIPVSLSSRPILAHAFINRFHATRDPGTHPVCYGRGGETGISLPHRRQVSSCNERPTFLSRHGAFILVRAHARPHIGRYIYLGWFEFNGHRHCAYTRPARPLVRLHFSFIFFFFLFLFNGITRGETTPIAACSLLLDVWRRWCSASHTHMCVRIK